MKRRFLVVIGVAAVILAAVLSQRLAPARGGDDASTTTDARTPWGEPNLQGIWTNNYQVPLERPARYADKEFFTEVEIAELDKIRAASVRLGDRGVAKKGTVQHVAGAYNSVFTTTKHTGRRTSLIVDPPDGRIPPVTPAAQERRAERREFELALLQATEVCKNKMPQCAGGTYGPPSPRRAEPGPYYGAMGFRNRADGPEDRSLSERCMSFGLPDFGSSILPFFPRIVQSPGAVSIYYDVGQGNGWQRIIPITTAPHLPSNVRQWWGDSRGHWEGDTLVVDVTNFTAKKSYRGSRENLHLVERFTRLDADTLEYVATIEDPTTWTRPWTVKQEWTRQDNQANRIYYEPRCHEGNYGLAGQLVGTRADERAFAEGRGPDPATLCIGSCGNGITEENRDPLR